MSNMHTWAKVRSKPASISARAHALSSKAEGSGSSDDHAQAAKAHATAAGAAFARGDKKLALQHAAKRSEHEKASK